MRLIRHPWTFGEQLIGKLVGLLDPPSQAQPLGVIVTTDNCQRICHQHLLEDCMRLLVAAEIEKRHKQPVHSIDVGRTRCQCFLGMLDRGLRITGKPCEQRPARMCVGKIGFKLLSTVQVLNDCCSPCLLRGRCAQDHGNG